MQKRVKKVLILTILVVAVTLFFNNATYAIDNTKDTIKKLALLKMPDSWNEVETQDISGFKFEVQLPDGDTEVYDCSQIQFEIDNTNPAKTVFLSDKLWVWLYTDNTITFIFKEYDDLATSISKNDFRYYNFKNDSQTYTFSLDKEIENQTIFDINKDYPSQYDLRDRINIRVDDQGGFGLCWDFALTKALETTYALKTGNDLNLSEMYIDHITSNINGRGDRPLHRAGSHANYYNEVIRSGICGEEEIPYNEEANYNMNALKKCTRLVLPQSAFLIDENEISLYRSKEIIKKMIKEQLTNNGAVTITITFYQDNFDSEDYTFFLPTYCTQNNFATHEVTIIGWDDSFSKEKFKRHTYISNNYYDDIEPKEDGAWIVLNSWGNEYGDNGIFYLSYESDIKKAFGYLDVIPYEDRYEYTYVENEYKKYKDVTLTNNQKRYFYQEFNVKGDNRNITHITIANAIRGKVYYIDNYNQKDEINFDNKEFIGDFAVSTSTIAYNFMTWSSGGNPLKSNFVLNEPIEVKGDKFLIIVEIDGDYVNKVYLNNDGNTNTYYTDNEFSTSWSKCSGNLPIGVFSVNRQGGVDPETIEEKDNESEEIKEESKTNSIGAEVIIIGIGVVAILGLGAVIIVKIKRSR